MLTSIFGATVDPVDDVFLVIANVFLFTSAVLALIFVVLYQLLARWEESAWGWNIIITNIALFFVLTLGVGAAFFGYDYPGREIFRTLVFGAVLFTVVHHIYLLVKLQWKNRDKIRDSFKRNKKEGSDVH